MSSIPLQNELKKSYLTLFETASKLEYSDSQITEMQEYLKQAQDYCVGRFESVSTTTSAGWTNPRRH
jgi:hypothetical protein